MRRFSILALALGLIAFLPTVPVRAQEEGVSGVIHAIRASQPRDFGYFPGDVITREIYVAVDDAYHLQDASVPRKGALNYWLDLRSVKVKSDEAAGERRYLITLTYQTFYVPLEVKRRDLPGFALQFAPGDTEDGADIDTEAPADAGPAGEEAANEVSPRDEAMATAHIPSWTFLMSPLREIQTPEPPEGPVGFLKPDRAPQPLDLGRLTLLFAVSGLAAALFLVLLAHHYAWGPFRSRPARPFTVASRTVKAKARGRGDDQAYTEALLALHRAFDETAGHRVFAEDAAGFLEQNATFKPHADEISRFYEASRLAFFKGDVAAARAVMSLPDLAALAGKLGAAERRS